MTKSRKRFFGLSILWLGIVSAAVPIGSAELTISDSANASPASWVVKERGLFNGLDIQMIYISGSTRGVQSLIAGDVAFDGAVGASALYGKLAE